MIRKLAAVILSLSLVIGVLGWKKNVQATAENWVIYFVPHPDDEALTFSVPIMNDIGAGKKVKLVLLSHGEESIAREVVNGQYDNQSRFYWKAGEKVYCKWHQRYHNPEEEGYHYMDLATFGDERVKEFYRSVSALGIPSSHIDVYNLPNNHFRYSQVAALVRHYAQIYRGAEFKTMSQVDFQGDHAVIGKVINDLYRQHVIQRKTNYYSIYMDRFSGRHVPGYTVYLENSADKPKVLAALGVYKEWDPVNGRFGLGYHSVPAQFDAIAQNIYAKVARY